MTKKDKLLSKINININMDKKNTDNTIIDNTIIDNTDTNIKLDIKIDSDKTDNQFKLIKEKKEKIPKEKKEKILKEKKEKIPKEKKEKIPKEKKEKIPKEKKVNKLLKIDDNDNQNEPKKRGRKPILKGDIDGFTDNVDNTDNTDNKNEPKLPMPENTKKKGKNPKESYGLNGSNQNYEEDDEFFNPQEVEKDCIETPIIRLNVTANDIRKIKDPNFNEADSDLGIPGGFVGSDDFSYFQGNIIDKEENIKIASTDLQQLRVTREKELENAETNNDSKLLCQFIEHNKKGSWPEKSVYDCMFCRFPFDNTPWAIPYRINSDGKYEVFGNFCSPNCTASYIFNNFEDDEMWDRYALLNILYQKVYNSPGAIVKSAPDILFLKKLGGLLTIEEYREISSNSNKNYYIKMPPMVSIIPSVEELQQTSLFNDNSNREHLNKELMMKANDELRLRRAKPIYDDTNTLDNYFHISNTNPY